MNELKNIELLVHVAQAGSFTAAARRCGMTTAAVSKIVSRLERDLGARIFHRTTRQVSLTTLGAAFIEQAALALQQFEQAVDLARRGTDDAHGVVRVTANANFGKEHLMPLLPAFFERYPKIHLEMRLHDGVFDLVKEGFDLGIQNLRGGEGSYVSRRLCTLPLALVASPGYLERHGRPRVPADLEKHHCINVLLSTGQVGRWRFRPLDASPQPEGDEEESVYGYTPQGRFLISEQYDGVVNAALAGLGITVVFAHSALRHLRSGELRLLLPDHAVEGGSIENSEIFVRYPQRKFMPSAARSFVDYLMDHYRQGDRFAFDPAEFAG